MNRDRRTHKLYPQLHGLPTSTSSTPILGVISPPLEPAVNGLTYPLGQLDLTPRNAADPFSVESIYQELLPLMVVAKKT